MARPEQVPHGHWLGKIVRVFPERIDVALYRQEAEERIKIFPGDDVEIGTDDDIRRRCVEFARERGYESGTVCKVVMVSRMGDVGLTKNLDADCGYSLRVYPECIELRGAK